MNILLAEDDPLDAKLTLAALNEFTGENGIVAVQDGEQVLDYLYCRGKFARRQGGNPCAVLLDLKMPKIDGLKALKMIKSDEHLKMVPVVMLTSSGEAADVTACYEQGANAYVVKPVDFTEFVNVVKSLGAFWAKVNEAPMGKNSEPLCRSIPEFIPRNERIYEIHT